MRLPVRNECNKTWSHKYTRFQLSKNNETYIFIWWIERLKMWKIGRGRTAEERSKCDAASVVAPADFSFIHKTMCLFCVVPYIHSLECKCVCVCLCVSLFVYSHCVCVCERVYFVYIFSFHYKRLRILNVRLNMLCRTKGTIHS